MTRSYRQYLIKSRHGSVFYARIPVPPDLRARFAGRREFRRSLGTAQRREALGLARHWWVIYHVAFERLRGGALSKNKQILDVGWALFVDSIGRRVEVDYPDDPDREARVITALREQDNVFAVDNPELITTLTSRSQPQSSQQPEPSNPSTFDKSALEFLDRYKTRGGGKTKRPPKAATFDKERQIVNLWRAYFGQTPIHKITVEDINTAQREIEKLPAGRAQRGLSDAEAIALTKTEHNLPVLTGHNTVPKYTVVLRQIFAYAKLQRSLLDDPSDVLETTQDKTVGKKVLPFTLDDVAKIFPGSGYVQQLQHSRTKNSKRLYTAHFWLPILAAFSGARIEELAQLTVSDIVCDPETEIHCLRITDEGVAGDGGRKSVKNASSKRLLPLHDTVIAIGFLKFVKECRRVGGDSSGLFELERGSESGRLGKTISQWFSRSDGNSGYLQRCGVQTHMRDVQGRIVSSKSFHSWRHTVRDVLRMQPHPRTNGMIAEGEIDYVTGHAPTGSAGVKYGTGKRPLDLIQELINAINYPGVDFDAIRWTGKGDQPGNGK